MQWLSLPGTKLCLNDDYEIVALNGLEECKGRCISWSNGPCKSLSWQFKSRDHNYESLCCLSRGDQHSNLKDMITMRGSEHVENCEGKNTVSIV